MPTADWECLDVPGGPQVETSVTAAVDARFRTLRAGHPELVRANTPREYLPTMPVAVMLSAGRTPRPT